MSLPTELPELSFEERRQQLSLTIARQRTELAEAYLKLEKPIRYTEYGMRGFGFVRQNPWIFAAVPATFSIVSNIFGFGKKKSKSGDSQSQVARKGSSIPNRLKTVAGYGWQLYQLYRRIRP